MRGRLGYVLPDSAYLRRIILIYHLIRWSWLCNLYMASSALQILFPFYTPHNLSIGQCTHPIPTESISCVTSKSFNTLPSHISLHHITLCYVIMELQRVRRPEGPQDWEAQRAVITDLYITKGLELEHLMEIMEKDHFFKATYDHVDD